MAFSSISYGRQSSQKVDYVPPIASVKAIFIFEKQNKIFMAGETIHGFFHVISVPQQEPLLKINGLLLELVGQLQFLDKVQNLPTMQNTFVEKKYFFGSVTGPPTELKKGDYKFAFTIPEDCPPSFTTTKSGKGCIKYYLRCIGHESVEGCHRFEDYELLTITPRAVHLWKNHKYYCQPMISQRQIIPWNIDICLNLNHKCYQPGHQIQFVVKIKNGGRRSVKAMALQLHQTVNYNLPAGKQNDKVMLLQVKNGPSVPVNSDQIWNGEMKVPEFLSPSVIDEITRITPVSFQYKLRLKLDMAGILSPKLSEDFSIDIGPPVAESPLQDGGIRELNTYQLSHIVAQETSTRRNSMSTVEPINDVADTFNRSGAPPSYSSHDLQASQL